MRDAASKHHGSLSPTLFPSRPHYRPPHPPVSSLFRALSAGTVQAPTPCPADDMCGSSLPPNRRPSESTSSRIPAEIALICSGKTALMHPWVHFDMFLTLPRPSSSMSRAKSPPWREPPAGVLTAIHTPSALPRPRAGAGHDSMHLPCARRQPGQQPGQQASNHASSLRHAPTRPRLRRSYY